MRSLLCVRLYIFASVDHTCCKKVQSSNSSSPYVPSLLCVRLYMFASTHHTCCKNAQSSNFSFHYVPPLLRVAPAVAGRPPILAAMFMFHPLLPLLWCMLPSASWPERVPLSWLWPTPHSGGRLAPGAFRRAAWMGLLGDCATARCADLKAIVISPCTRKVGEVSVDIVLAGEVGLDLIQRTSCLQRYASHMEPQHIEAISIRFDPNCLTGSKKRAAYSRGLTCFCLSAAASARCLASAASKFRMYCNTLK